jgi:hypothetical protein
MKSLTFSLLLSVILFSCKKDPATSISLTRSDDGKYLTNYTVRSSCTSCDLTQPITITGTGYTPRLQIVASVHRKNFSWVNYEVISRDTVATVDNNGNFSFAYDASAYPPSDWRMYFSQVGSNARVTRNIYGELLFSTF